MATTKTKSDGAYLWLEEVEGPKALAWVRAENERSSAELHKYPRFDEFKGAALKILEAKDKLAVGHIQGEFVYNFWQDSEHVRGIWRRTSWQSYQSGKPDWQLLLDVDDLAKRDGKNYVYRGAVCLRPAYERCLVKLSDGGSDASYFREFDLTTKQFVTEGYDLAPSKSGLIWSTQDRVFFKDATTQENRTSSGYPRVVRAWARGKAAASAPVVFEGAASDVSVHAVVIHDGDQEHVFFTRAMTFFTEKLYYDLDGELAALPLPTDISLQGVYQGQLLFINRSALGAIPAGSLVATDLRPLIKGKPEFTAVFTPSVSQALKSVARSQNYLFVSLLDDVRGKVVRLERKASEDAVQWETQNVSLPGQGSVGLVSVDDDSDRLLLSYEDFLVPPSLYAVEGGSLKKTLVQQVPPRFDATGLTITQEFAVSKDGTRVPYFLVHKEGIKYDGKNPTLLYGYGGFEVPMQPNYAAAVGKLWLERGGVYALANIRGGGEFGPRWHQAALKEKRQTAFDDFAAVAEDLISHKITSPRHLGIQGGSNGGLLMGATFTQRPELFHAVICQVPLLDMLRYHKLLAGASWMAEYGDPDDPAMRSVIQRYSPFQNLKGDKSYPRVFFVTSTKDDRVHPGHARKMAARMQDLRKPFLYFENIEGGHGASANLQQHAERYALEYSYLWAQLSGS
ncbi:MAG: S9 family peptidase [Deltaproteobacteria bacterium]|nr:S9 family peptidase [Deltaproteobacteria bacterium]